MDLPDRAHHPVTLNGGMRMTGWYDINDLSIEGIIDDREQTLASAAYVASLVDEAIAEGVPSERILIGGFSQGGVIALTAALRSEKKLAGCAARPRTSPCETTTPTPSPRTPSLSPSSSRTAPRIRCSVTSTAR